MANFSELLHRKVIGIPVLYWAGGFVAILAIVAWRIKPATPPDTPPTDNGGTDVSDPSIGDLGDYTGLGTTGTVTVVQQPSNAAIVDPVIKTNESWVRDGAEWLTASKGVAGSQAAAALNKYVSGLSRSYQEQEWVDDVIREKGQPPDSIAEGGSVDPKPAVKQFPQPPGTHTITGNSDTTFRNICQLYYGHSTSEDINLVQAANPTFGGTLGPFAVGTKVVVPVFHDPVRVNSGRVNVAWRDFARQNGLTEAQLHYLNDTQVWARQSYIPAYTMVRVK